MTFDRESWRPDPTLVREVTGQFQRAIDSYRIQPNLIVEHANLEESIRTGGYANRTLLELVQNAADAIVGAEDDGEAAGRVEIVLDTKNEVLYCANAGRPFSLSGITAISMAYLSGKRGDEIGRFGLGFKSVLAVSDAPQVFSRSISFEFFSQESRAALSSVAPTASRYPILRTATVVDALESFEDDPILADLAQWATTIVKLPNAISLDRLRAEIETFRSEFLLFVGAVREVRLRVLGKEPFRTSHVSRDRGDGVLVIERPDGAVDEWAVSSQMHAPTLEARRQVGEAVSRSEVKVTVAIPSRQARLRTGQFWSYFPLQDTTSASALFNAPWSVNDDRTTLLHNDYNREILRTVADMFVELLPRVRTPDDPAAHLDFMPARGREIQSFGDELLTAHVPAIGATRELIPDANGDLRNGAVLKPLEFGVRFDAEVHHGWIQSPNTADDVPHWLCYRTTTRATRLRDLFVAGAARDLETGARDFQKALDSIPKRGILSWLREWADGTDPVSAANALNTVVRNPKIAGIDTAKVIPTSAGMRSIADRRVVFLNRDADLEIEGAVFVSPTFLRQKGVEDLLKSHGFRDLDPEAILNARLAQLAEAPTDEKLTKLWDAVLDVAPQAAARIVKASTAQVKVPTRDGGWAWPRQVLDIETPLGPEAAPRLLDRHRCVPDVAYQLGVIRQPIKSFDAEDEPAYDEYRRWVIADLNERRGTGERPLETMDSIDLTPGSGPGPFSVLLMMRDAGAPDAARESWTSALLARGDEEWTCEDIQSGRVYTVSSPARWAVERAGLLRTDRGFRPPSRVVAPSLLRYAGLLPLFKGPRLVQDALDLPDELQDVPAELLREMLEEQIFPSNLADDVMVQFILTAAREAFDGARPATIPARVKRAVEPRPPDLVYVATTDEQEEFLRDRQRPYLRTTADLAAELVGTVGCRRFEDSFAFSMIVDGQYEPERALDMYTGLRNRALGGRLADVRVSRAVTIAKRVTTEDGVEDQALDWNLDGSDLVVRADADEKQILRFINEALDLRLDNAEITSVLRAGLDHRLEELRQQARSVETDAARLELYIGDDDLREALPKGLWSALEAQGLVDDSTSVAELFLTVYADDSLRILADRFRDEGFSDVPQEWAGRDATLTWVRKMGFGSEYAGHRSQPRPAEFVVPGAVQLNPLHSFQKKISEKLRVVLTQPSERGPAQKGMVELPTGAGKTRVATETILKLFKDEVLSGTILWIAQSIELCEQAVQTFQEVWRDLGDERPLTIGRLWESNTVREPDTELSIVVATDAKLEAIRERPEYEWLGKPTAVFIDEAHRAGGSTRYTGLLRWLGVDGLNWERPLVGLSATPFKGRASDTTATTDLARRFGNNRMAPFKKDENAYKELVKLGVLASVKHEVLPGIDVQLSSGERTEIESKQLIDRQMLERIGRSEARMRVLVDHILQLNPAWPVLVFTPSVLSAQVLAATLRYRKVDAEAVSGQTGHHKRRKVIDNFKKGDIRVLANCDLLVQGFDAPGVRALYIARPTFSPSAYIQMAGRGLRGPKNGGKDECLIVDVADNWGAVNDFLGYHEYEDLWKEQGE